MAPAGSRPGRRVAPPVSGPVSRAFSPGPSPFAAGYHRGVDLSAAPGAHVLAPVPAGWWWPVGWGRAAASSRCCAAAGGPACCRSRQFSCAAARWSAPEPLLGALARSAAHAGLHLGVRRDGVRFGYVDPLRFLAAIVGPRPATARARATRPPARTSRRPAGHRRPASRRPGARASRRPGSGAPHRPGGTASRRPSARASRRARTAPSPRARALARVGRARTRARRPRHPLAAPPGRTPAGWGGARAIAGALTSMCDAEA